MPRQALDSDPPVVYSHPWPTVAQLGEHVLPVDATCLPLPAGRLLTVIAFGCAGSQVRVLPVGPLHPGGAMRMAYATTHRAEATLVVSLILDYPDGWALSCPSDLLATLLPVCPPTIRVMAWVKPGAVQSRSNPARAWEPLVVFRGRPREEGDDLQRDWLSVPNTRTARSRPDEFFYWVFR